MTATDGVATSGSRPELLSVTYLRLRQLGFDGPESANLTAVKNGFGITTQPWTVRELAHLLFLRESRRFRVDDRVDGRDVTGVATARRREVG
jgi:hypothetical protein